MDHFFDISRFVNVISPQSALIDLASRAKKYRKFARLSQKQLALRSGVSFASIRRFESSGNISLASLAKIALALNSLADFNSLFPDPINNSFLKFDSPKSISQENLNTNK